MMRRLLLLGGTLLLACTWYLKWSHFSRTPLVAFPDADRVIDGVNYLKGMRAVLSTGKILEMGDVFHAPGYQIWLWIFRLSNGSYESFLLSLRWANWLMIGAVAIIQFLIARRFAGANFAYFGSILFLSSDLIWTFSVLIQYEIVALFLFSLALLFFSQNQMARCGVSATLLCFIHARFIGLVLVLAFCARSSTSNVLRILLPFFIFGGTWSAYHTHRLGSPVIFSSGWGTHFRRGNFDRHEDLAGRPAPRTKAVGLEYLAEYPGDAIKSFWKKWKKTWGVERGLWYVPETWADQFKLDTAFRWIEMLFFIFGCVLIFKKGFHFIYLSPLLIILSSLVFLGCQRFLIPLYPAIRIVQVCFVVACLEKLKGFFRQWNLRMRNRNIDSPPITLSLQTEKST